MQIGRFQRTLAGGANERRGAIVVLFLALVMMVASVGLVLMRTGLSVNKRQALALDGKNAFYVAESGLAEAYWGLQNGKTGQVGTKSEPVYFGGGLFWVDTFPQGDDVYLLHSTGMYGRGSVSLSLAVRASAQDNAGAGTGIFSNQDIDVAPGVTIDGYDSNSGTYEEQLDAGGLPTVLGSLASNGNISFSGDASSPVVVHGDVHAGPEAVFAPGSGNTVTGSTVALPELVTVDPVVIPTYAPLPLSLTIGAQNPRLFSGNDREFDTITVGAGGVLVLEGPLNLVVDDLVVQAGGELEFDSAAGEIHLYVRSDLDLQAGSFTTTTSTDPWRLRVQAGADDPATPEVEGLYLGGSGSVHGILEAPEGHVSLGADLELFGSVTGDSVALEEGASFHVDASTLSGAVSDIRMVPDGVLLWEILALPEAATPGGDPFRTLGVVRNALPLPYDAHRVLWLQVDYLDDVDAPFSWSGWSTDVDPTILRSVERVEAYIDPADTVPVYVKTVQYTATDQGPVTGFGPSAF